MGSIPQQPIGTVTMTVFVQVSPGAGMICDALVSDRSGSDVVGQHIRDGGSEGDVASIGDIAAAILHPLTGLGNDQVYATMMQKTGDRG